RPGWAGYCSLSEFRVSTPGAFPVSVCLTCRSGRDDFHVVRKPRERLRTTWKSSLPGFSFFHWQWGYHRLPGPTRSYQDLPMTYRTRDQDIAVAGENQRENVRTSENC